MHQFPKKITLIEVGPRDGLQNEKAIVPTDLKIKFINALAQTGLQHIEATSFVSPQWVPQMADHIEVMQNITRFPQVNYMALVPNLHGLEDALQANTQSIAVFSTVSETFSQKNTNCSVEESLNRIAAVVEKARQKNLPVRGYLSCAIACPFEGPSDPSKVAQLAEKLLNMGCYQISLGDTIGVGTANQVETLLDAVMTKIPIEKIAVHFHDTYAQALTNIYVSLQKGITTIDAAVAGLGGCPYAPGAGGNVATEDVVYLANGLGIETGVDLNKLAQAGWLICDFLQQTPRSKVSVALRG